MTNINAPFDPRVIEAEENLLIDFQIQIQEMMSAKGVSRSELAEKAGISKARLSQILGNEANPTIKSMARLFLALGEKACVSRKRLEETSFEMLRPVVGEWHWNESVTGELRIDDRLVAVIKDTSASNDNYNDRFLMIDSELVAAA
jgi:transcriptional regulator with XRE-family HTH domain